MVRGRGRPQLGVQPGLQDGKALNRQFAHLPPAGGPARRAREWEGPEAGPPRKRGRRARLVPVNHILFFFVLVLFLRIGLRWVPAATLIRGLPWSGLHCAHSSSPLSR